MTFGTMMLFPPKRLVMNPKGIGRYPKQRNQSKTTTNPVDKQGKICLKFKMDTWTPQNSGISIRHTSSQRAILSISIPDFFSGAMPLQQYQFRCLTWKPFFPDLLTKKEREVFPPTKKQPCSMIQDSPCFFFRILQICRGIRQLFNAGF